MVYWKFNVVELQYKQCGVTPQFFTWENLLKKISRKDKCWRKLLLEKSKYWQNQFRKGFW